MFPTVKQEKHRNKTTASDYKSEQYKTNVNQVSHEVITPKAL